MIRQPLDSKRSAYCAIDSFPFQRISIFRAYAPALLYWFIKTKINNIKQNFKRLKIAFCPFDVAVERLASMFTDKLFLKNLVSVAHCNPRTTKITFYLPNPFTLNR